ncbi:MAG: ATP-grasp domain-containing protein [Acidimicrobiia bacterium]
MPRVLLLLPTSTYRAPDFMDAAQRLGVEVVVGSEAEQAMAADMGDRAVVVPMDDPKAGADAVVALHERSPIDAVVAVDDRGVEVAAIAGERLGLTHTDPQAVAATRDKSLMRELLMGTAVRQPAFAIARTGDDVPRKAAAVGYPIVVKPTTLSGSRGVIRADDETAARDAAQRIRAFYDGPILVEEYVPGVEVAVEALARGPDGFDVLAVFDKPDPLIGPYFEETIYVTPSRLPDEVVTRVSHFTALAARAIGIVEGPVHAELRIDGSRVWLIEIAARSIGGLCSRTLRFGAGIALEELILRHALGMQVEPAERELDATGVMMLPIPDAGVLQEVRGREAALAVPGITGLEITVLRGRAVQPLPEGDRYLGFLFAKAATPAEVEQALRTAHAELDVVLAPTSPSPSSSPTPSSS